MLFRQHWNISLSNRWFAAKWLQSNRTTPGHRKRTQPESRNLTLSADPSGALKFTKSKLTAKSGKVTIKMDNPSPVQHSVAIEGTGVDVKGSTVSKGGVSTVSANLKPGKYTFYCPVDGHRQAGMQGTLTVK